MADFQDIKITDYDVEETHGFYCIVRFTLSASSNTDWVKLFYEQYRSTSYPAGVQISMEDSQIVLETTKGYVKPELREKIERTVENANATYRAYLEKHARDQAEAVEREHREAKEKRQREADLKRKLLGDV